MLGKNLAIKKNDIHKRKSNINRARNLGADAYGDPYVTDDPVHGLMTQEEVDHLDRMNKLAEEAGY